MCLVTTTIDPVSLLPAGSWAEGCWVVHTLGSGRSEGAGLLSESGVILSIDVVESVRLIELAEAEFITRWVQLRRGLEDLVDQRQKARIVRSTGDGVIVECDSANRAVALAFDALKLSESYRGASGKVPALSLRIGIAEGEFLADDHDIYGASVNLACRLAGLARPNGIVISDRIMPHLIEGQDAVFEDLGMCFLKHMEKPVHAFGLTQVGSSSDLATLSRPDANLTPAIAVIPLVSRNNRADLIGDIIADDIIRVLSGTSLLLVLSRLSTSSFQNSVELLKEKSNKLGADYIVHGSYQTRSDQITAFLELTDSRSGMLLLQQELIFKKSDLMRPDFAILDAFAARLVQEIARLHRRRLRRQAMPTIESHALLLGSISMMHGKSVSDFNMAGDALEVLIERHPREALPRAWQACWQSILVAKGLSDDPHQDGLKARDQARRAIDLDPENSLALSVSGLIQTNFGKNFDEAERLFDDALAINPNDAHAVLHKGALHFFTDRGASAYALCLKARALSPCDPHLYYFEAITASAAFTAENYHAALDHAAQSIRHNETYAPALRVRTAALSWLGEAEKARQSAAELLAIEPGLTVSRWLARTPAKDFRNGENIAAGLRQAGVPE